MAGGIVSEYSQVGVGYPCRNQLGVVIEAHAVVSQSIAQRFVVIGVQVVELDVMAQVQLVEHIIIVDPDEAQRVGIGGEAEFAIYSGLAVS